jgi:hypothetical protein
VKRLLKTLAQFTILFSLFAVVVWLNVFISRRVHAANARNCRVSVFPVHVMPGDQCPMDFVLTGVDSESKKIACGKIQVDCSEL